MTNRIPNFDERYFGSFSREGLKAIKFMAIKWPKKKTFTNEEIGKEINIKGTSLGGILSAFSRKDSFPLIIKVGVATFWEGEKFTRPKQIWALNPKLKPEHIKKIKDILDNFLLD